MSQVSKALSSNFFSKETFLKNIEYLDSSCKKTALYLLEENSSFHPSVDISKNGYVSYQHQGRFLHSQINPIKEAEKKNKLISFNHQNRIFIIGADFLYQLELLLSQDTVKRVKELKVFLIYDSPLIFLNCFFSRDLSFLKKSKKKVYLIFEASNQILKQILDLQNITGVLFINNLHLFPSSLFLKTTYQSLEQGVKSWFSEVLTQLYFEKQWLKNSMINLNYLKKSSPLSHLKNAFLNQGCVLVAAGPSLYDEIKRLKEFQQKKIIILCCDTALRPLLLQGCVPDFVISLDSGYYNSLDFSILPPKACSLIAEFSVYPSILRRFKGSTFLFGLDGGLEKTSSGKILLDTLFDYKFKQNVIFPQRSIFNLGVKIGLYMGFNQFSFLGLDLSLPFGYSHCESTTHRQYFYKRSNRLFPITAQESSYAFARSTGFEKNINGEVNQVEHLLLLYRKELEDCIRQNKAIIFNNYSPRGLKIEGVSFNQESRTSVFETKEKKVLESINFFTDEKELTLKMDQLKEQLTKLNKLIYLYLFSLEKKQLDLLENLERQIKRMIKKAVYLEKSFYYLSSYQKHHVFENEFLRKYAFYKEVYKIVHILINKS